MRIAKPKASKTYQWFLVVEGRGSFPFDMLRYDAAFPYEQEDAGKLEAHHNERRRVVLCRRGVNENSGTEGRWKSFGWPMLLATADPGEALDCVRVGEKLGTGVG